MVMAMLMCWPKHDGKPTCKTGFNQIDRQNKDQELDLLHVVLVHPACMGEGDIVTMKERQTDTTQTPHPPHPCLRILTKYHLPLNWGQNQGKLLNN